MAEYEDSELTTLSVRVAPDTAQQIRDMAELKRPYVGEFTASDAVRRSLAIVSMMDALIPEGGRVIVRDDEGNEQHLVIV